MYHMSRCGLTTCLRLYSVRLSVELRCRLQRTAGPQGQAGSPSMEGKKQHSFMAQEDGDSV